ncbi:MAG: right-handed parallel beta-helix repeat-containing protein [Rhodospirillaceae bacterium]|nr:right-handed parallel beta-helix repeat-containing protein [Rhodospirillaceae bacterium]
MLRFVLILCCIAIALSGGAFAQVPAGTVFSSAQPSSRSFLRFHNTGAAAGTVAVTFRDFATGQSLGTWTSTSVPVDGELQFAIAAIETALGLGATKPDYYSITMQPGIAGYYQHVLWRPADGTLTNLSTCASGVTADARQLSGVHSSLLQSGYPSTVVVSNTGTVPTTATLGVYNANTGAKRGTYTTASIPAGGQVLVSIPAIEASTGLPASDLYHYVIKTEGAFTGYLQHLVNNMQAGVNTDMTGVCALGGAASTAVPAPLPAGTIFSSAQPSSRSFLRFHNTGAGPGTVTVTFRDFATGQSVGTWTSTSVPVDGELQFAIADIENTLGLGANKPAYYAVSMQSSINGYFQHVLWRPADGTLTNLSTCAAGVTADSVKLSGVHTSLLQSGYPSSVVVSNTGTAATTVTLGVYNANTGVKRGNYVTPSIPAGGQALVAIPTIEATTGLPSSDLYHYVIKAESAFTGYLQHLVNNMQAGVITDMTAVCALGGMPIAATANFYVSPTGSDAAAGTLAAPFATFERARNAVRSFNKTGRNQVVVQFRGGTYHLPATLTLIPADSGSAATEIVYQNFPGETPVISGGVRVQNWTNVSGNTWRATLPTTTVNFESLFYNGVRRLRPRLGSSSLGTYYRVGETVYLDGAAPPAAAPNANCPTFVTGRGWECFDRFKYKSGDPISATWQNLAPPAGNACGQTAGNTALVGDVELILFEKYSAAKLRVSCVDTANRIVYLTGPTGATQFQSLVSGFIPEHRYLIENVRDQLSQPGQWFLDRSATPWTLTYLANPGENPNTDTVIVPQLTHVMIASGVQHISFQGLSFEHDNFTIPTAGLGGNEVFRFVTPIVSIQNSQNMTFDRVTIARTTGMGLSFTNCISNAILNATWCAAGAANPVIADNTVQNSTFYDLGASAIGVGFQQRTADTDANVPQHMTIRNNVIAGYGRVLPNAFGTFQGTAHSILYTHNDIYDGYRAAIHICPCNHAFKGPNSNGAFNNVISFNHAYNLMQGIMNDAGGIRILSGGPDYSAPGNRIYSNKVHDVSDASALDADGYGGDGIYVDDVTGDIDIQNNLIYRVSRAAVNITQAPYAPNLANTIKNNIFAFARLAMIQNNGPYPTGAIPAQAIRIFTATNNLFYFSRRSTSTPAFYVQSGCHYSGGFPFASFQHRQSNLYWRADGAFASDANAFRVQNTPIAAPFFCANLALTPQLATSMTFAAWQAFGQDLGSQVKNPGFANPAYPADDFSLPSGSPGSGFVVFDPNAAGRTSAAFTPPAVAATFPTATFNPATDF